MVAYPFPFVSVNRAADAHGGDLDGEVGALSQSAGRHHDLDTVLVLAPRDVKIVLVPVRSHRACKPHVETTKPTVRRSADALSGVDVDHTVGHCEDSVGGKRGNERVKEKTDTKDKP